MGKKYAVKANSVSHLNDIFHKVIMDILKNNVSEEVKKRMIDAYQKYGYDVYKPRMYQRHYDNGGMTDPNNIEISNIENGVKIENITEHDNRRIAPIWEKGKEAWKPKHKPDHQVDDEPMGIWTKPRPVIQNLYRDLMEDDTIRKEIIKGFKKFGLKVI